MNQELSQSFHDILNGLVKAQFNLNVRSARFFDALFSVLVQFAVLLIVAFFLGDTKIIIILAAGVAFIGGTFIYHIKTDINRVDLKASFFFIIYSGIFLPVIYYYCGRDSLGAALLLINVYFCLFFILKLLPAFLISLFASTSWYFVFFYYDTLKDNGLPAADSNQFDTVITTAAFFVTVLTIGSLIKKTIYAYDKEQTEAKQLFEDYNKKLYKHGSRNAFNDRFLLSNVATLGVLTEKGDLPGFTAVVLSIDNFNLIENLSDKASNETYDVFARKITNALEEDEIFVRQERNSYAIILNTIQTYEVEEKMNEIIATIHMTIFEHLPKDRLSISAGYAIHTAGHSTARTMQKSADNMLVARRRGGNCVVGGNEK